MTLSSIPSAADFTKVHVNVNNVYLNKWNVLCCNFHVCLPCLKKKFCRSYYVMDCSDEATENCATHFMCLDAQIALRTGVIDRDLRSCVTSKEHCDGEAQCGDASDECDCSDSVFCPSPGQHALWNDAKLQKWLDSHLFLLVVCSASAKHD